MATIKNLGRVQTWSMFYSSQNESYYVLKKNLYPLNLTPLIGDHILFSNGSVRAIIDTDISSVTCGDRLFTLKGKDGINGADLIDVQQTTTSAESGGTNVITFTMKDGTKRTVSIKNGIKGADGENTGADSLVVERHEDENILYLSSNGAKLGEGVVLPKGGSGSTAGTNYLANSNFAVNQRAKQEYDEVGEGRKYTVDRWAKNMSTGDFVVKKDKKTGVKITGEIKNAGEIFVQPIEDNFFDGEQVTLSAQVSKASNNCYFGIKAKGSVSKKPVSNTGTIGTITFDTSKSIDEVVAALSQLDLNIEGMMYFILANEDLSKAIGVQYMDGVWGIADSMAEEYLFFSDDAGFGFVGWNPNFNGTYEVNANVISNLQGMFDIGHQNDLLVDFMGIVDSDSKSEIFEKARVCKGKNSLTVTLPADTKEMVCGFFADDGIGQKPIGQPVPNDGSFVEKIYFNLQASAKQVYDTILPLLLNNHDKYYIFASQDGTSRIVAERIDDVIYIYDDKKHIDYYDSSYNGWEDITSNILLNTASSSFTHNGEMDVPVGMFNQDISSIVSTTPLFKGQLPVCLPNDGSVSTSKIRLDTTMSAQQVDDVIESANLPWTDLGYGIYGRQSYVVASVDVEGTVVPVIGISKYDNGYAIWCETPTMLLYASNQNLDKSLADLQYCTPFNSNRLNANVYGALKLPRDFATVDLSETEHATKNDKLTEIIYALTTSDLTLQIDWTKLEVGKVATEYTPPVFAQDLAECKRFCQKFSYNGVVGYAPDKDNLLKVAIPLTMPMRDMPTLANGGRVKTYSTIEAMPIFEPSVSRLDENAVQMTLVAKANQNTQAGSLYMLGDFEDLFDAEIY